MLLLVRWPHVEIVSTYLRINCKVFRFLRPSNVTETWRIFKSDQSLSLSWNWLCSVGLNNDNKMIKFVFVEALIMSITDPNSVEKKLVREKKYVNRNDLRNPNLYLVFDVEIYWRKNFKKQTVPPSNDTSTCLPVTAKLTNIIRGRRMPIFSLNHTKFSLIQFHTQSRRCAGSYQIKSPTTRNTDES